MKVNEAERRNYDVIAGTWELHYKYENIVFRRQALELISAAQNQCPVVEPRFGLFFVTRSASSSYV